MSTIVRLDVNKLQPVIYKAGWESLELPKGHKKMVQAMVDVFSANSKLDTGSDMANKTTSRVDKIGFDLVENKGKVIQLSDHNDLY